MRRKEITLIILDQDLLLKIENKVLADNRILKLLFRHKNLSMIFISILIEMIRSRLEA
jgi:hypothetical protein